MHTEISALYLWCDGVFLYWGIFTFIFVSKNQSINRTHSYSFEVLVWAQVGLEAELVLACHLALVSAWVHQGSDLEGLKLGVYIERWNLKSLPFFLKQKRQRGVKRAVVESLFLTPTLLLNAGNSCHTIEASQEASLQSLGMFIIVLNNVSVCGKIFKLKLKWKIYLLHPTLSKFTAEGHNLFHVKNKT